MKVSLIQVPYHMGITGVGMGKGPARLVERGLAGAACQQGFQVRLDEARSPTALTGAGAAATAHRSRLDEVAAVTQVNAALAARVAEAVEGGWFPLVLAGNCNSCLGVLSGLAMDDIGMVWFDSHADFNTPETSVTGFFDGMPLAVATGRCYSELWPEMGKAGPVPEDRVLLVGVRDVDPSERGRLAASRVKTLYAQEARHHPGGPAAALAARLAKPGPGWQRAGAERVYLHLDTDVIDPSEAPGVDFPSEGGLSVADLCTAVSTVADRLRVVAAAVTAYNPDRDISDRTASALITVVGALLAAVAGAEQA